MASRERGSMALHGLNLICPDEPNSKLASAHSSAQNLVRGLPIAILPRYSRQKQDQVSFFYPTIAFVCGVFTLRNFCSMKRLLLSGAFFLLLAGTSVAQTQPVDSNPWFTPDAVVSPTPTVNARPSTDYNGRPVRNKVRERAIVAQTDSESATASLTYPTGWSVAPGMPMGANRRPTTDYWGRPLKATTHNSSVVAHAALKPTQDMAVVALPNTH